MSNNYLLVAVRINVMLYTKLVHQLISHKNNHTQPFFQKKVFIYYLFLSAGCSCILN